MTLWPTMTPDECDRLLTRARIRKAEREARGGWIAHHIRRQQTLSPAKPANVESWQGDDVARGLKLATGD